MQFSPFSLSTAIVSLSFTPREMELGHTAKGEDGDMAETVDKGAERDEERASNISMQSGEKAF